MRTRCTTLVIIGLFSLAGGAAGGSKPAHLLDSYRDFATYTTSQPDPDDPTHVVATMQLVNRGQRNLPVRVSLDRTGALGFDGAQFESRIVGGETRTWKFDFQPPQDLVKEIKNTLDNWEPAAGNQ
jgi:hypothetical protein